MVTFRDDIHSDYGQVFVHNCHFSHSKGTGVRMGCAEIYESTISDCRHGILLASSNSGLVNSTIENNSGYPIYFDGLKMTLDAYEYEERNFFIEEFGNNTFRNNGQNYFAIRGKVEIIPGDLYPGPIPNRIEWNNLSIPYLVTSPLEFYGLDILIWEGTLVKFKYYPEDSKKPYIYLDPESSLSSINLTGSEQIIFTSEYDHRYDYEYFSGKHRDSMAGDWGYIEGSDFDLSNCVFKYGGVYVNPNTGEVIPDSSAVIRINAGTSGSTIISNSLFNSLYRHGTLFLFEPSVDHPVHIDSTSFLLDKNAYRIKTVESAGTGTWSIDARNNYWYGRLGPFNPDSNAVGNGCRIDHKIDFRPFLESSKYKMELVSLVVRGVARNLDDEIIPNALIKIRGKKEKTVYSKEDGSYYISNVYPGYGYEMQAFAARHKDTIYENLEILKDTTHIVDVYLRERTIDYLVDTITFKINPAISEVQVGGTAYRYYKVVDRVHHEPVYGVEVFVEGLVDTFY